MPIFFKLNRLDRVWWIGSIICFTIFHSVSHTQVIHDGRKPNTGVPRRIGKLEIPEAFRFQFAVSGAKYGCSTMSLPTHGGRLLGAVINVTWFANFNVHISSLILWIGYLWTTISSPLESQDGLGIHSSGSAWRICRKLVSITPRMTWAMLCHMLSRLHRWHPLVAWLPWSFPGSFHSMDRFESCGLIRILCNAKTGTSDNHGWRGETAGRAQCLV